jgi:cell division protein ZapA (FtsZ GTPase activity inhibitor)
MNESFENFEHKGLIKMPSLTDSDDVLRVEEKYNKVNESFIEAIRQSSTTLSNKHMVACKKYRKRYIILSIPMAVLPIIMANLSVFMLNMSVYVVPISLTLISVMNALMLIYNYGERSERHNSFSGKYDALSFKIEAILIRSKSYRPPFDIVLSTITEEKKNIDNMAPLL